MNTAEPAPTQVAAYLADIAAGLYGPRRRRQRILAELRDGLDLSVADHTVAGRSPGQAIAAAIDQFGHPQTIASGFAAELAIAYARRTLALFVATGPMVGIWWLLLLHPHPWHTGLIPLVAAIPVVPLIAAAIATAAGTIATTGRLIRWVPEATPQRALTATIIVTALTITGDLTVIGVYLLANRPMQQLAAIAATASLTRIGCSIVTARHAVLLRRRMAQPAVPAR